METQDHHRNFWIVNVINSIFFSGYLILKFPLAYILSRQGMSLQQAYSLTTTSTIAFALSSLALIWIMKNYHNQKHILFLGIIFNLIATLFLETRHYPLEIVGLAFYVIGGSLYFFNITLMFNKQFSAPRDRLQGNYIAQICLNIGAFFGLMIFLFAASSGHLYFVYSIAFITVSLILLIICYTLIKDDSASIQQQYRLYGSCAIMFLLILLCLQHNIITRLSVLCVFFVVTILAIYQSKKNHKPGYLTFIMLILLFSLPFWVGNTILYNQFFVFLHSDVFSFYGLPAVIILLLDPIGNIFFGLLWGKLTHRSSLKPYVNLQLGMLLIVIGFGLLFCILETHLNVNKISAIYPAITVLLFSCAQFLIQPTLRSHVSDLIDDHQQMVFALGVLRAVRSVAAVVAFYLIDTTTKPSQAEPLHQNILLYSTISVIALIATIIFYTLRKTTVIAPEIIAR